MNEYIFNLVKRQFKLDLNSDHGTKHWKRVQTISNYLAEQTKADIEVINLFAYLHDIKRENETDDPEHGERASIFVKELYDEKQIKISEKQLNQLVFACRYHSDPKSKSDDTTIQTCWDSDRLDLWRVGIIPDSEHLSLEVSKLEMTRKFALKLWQTSKSQMVENGGI